MRQATMTKLIIIHLFIFGGILIISLDVSQNSAFVLKHIVFYSIFAILGIWGVVVEAQGCQMHIVDVNQYVVQTIGQ